MFTLFSYFIVLPTPIPEVYFFPSYALLGFFAALFGPVSGAVISLAGMLFVGLWRAGFDTGLWLREYFFLSYTIASVVCGFIYGFAKKYVHADCGNFGYDGIIAYNVIQIAGNLAAWSLVAPVLELLFRPGRPAGEVFLQGLTAAFVDILSAEFIGTPLLLIHARIRKHRLAQREAPDNTGA